MHFSLLINCTFYQRPHAHEPSLPIPSLWYDIQSDNAVELYREKEKRDNEGKWRVSETKERKKESEMEKQKKRKHKKQRKAFQRNVENNM